MDYVLAPRCCEPVFPSPLHPGPGKKQLPKRDRVTPEAFRLQIPAGWKWPGCAEDGVAAWEFGGEGWMDGWMDG